MNITSMSLEQCRERYVDYLRGNLSGVELELFEQGFNRYPELEGELERVRALTTVLDRNDYQVVMEHRARNLSVRVHSALHGRGIRGRRHLGAWASALAVAVAVGIVFIPQSNNNSSSEIFEQELEHVLLSDVGDSLGHISLPPADLGAGEFEYAVSGVPLTSTSEITHLQDLADGLIMASDAVGLSKEQRAIESLELLVREELVEVDNLMKEFDDVSSL